MQCANALRADEEASFEPRSKAKRREAMGWSGLRERGPTRTGDTQHVCRAP